MTFRESVACQVRPKYVTHRHTQVCTGTHGFAFSQVRSVSEALTSTVKAPRALLQDGSSPVQRSEVLRSARDGPPDALTYSFWAAPRRWPTPDERYERFAGSRGICPRYMVRNGRVASKFGWGRYERHGATGKGNPTPCHDQPFLLVDSWDSGGKGGGRPSRALTDLNEHQGGHP